MQIHRKKIIVIGAGLSGLTAADELLTYFPESKVIILQAMDRVGGRTHTININGFKFDQGAQFIGQSQKYIIQLALKSGNKLIPAYSKGKKLIEMKKKVYTYETNIPNNVHLLGLIQLQWCMTKVNRMSKKVSTLDPKNCSMGYYWDSISVQTWVNRNISFQKVKIMFQVAVRSIFGVDPSEISFLYFLYYVHQNKDFENLINIDNGLQQKKTQFGTQHFSFYLLKEIQKKGGKIHFKSYVRRIEQKQNLCYVKTDHNQYICDYLIIGCAPYQINKVDFIPPLSEDRKLLCNRSFMGAYIKMILLYKKAYWIQKGFSGEILTDCYDSPLMTAYDDTKVNQNGETQPALIVFLGGNQYRFWKQKDNLQSMMIKKIAQILKQPEMLHPVQVRWKPWEDELSIGGGPTGNLAPGVLSQISDLRKPEGLIHWAGTELATVSIGYMDGAIESGKRAAFELKQRIEGKQKKKIQQKRQESPWYTKYLRGTRQYFQWL